MSFGVGYSFPPIYTARLPAAPNLNVVSWYKRGFPRWTYSKCRRS
jgi:hypothetical protein